MGLLHMMAGWAGGGLRKPIRKPNKTSGKSVCFFCCLVFFVVWAFRVLFFLLFGRGRVLFCCLGGGVFFLLLFGPGACFFFFFCCLGGGREFTHLPVCLARL